MGGKLHPPYGIIGRIKENKVEKCLQPLSVEQRQTLKNMVGGGPTSESFFIRSYHISFYFNEENFVYPKENASEGLVPSHVTL